MGRLKGKLMPHTYVSNLIHCVFSTKGRRKIISSELQESLWPFIGGIARQNAMKALSIGGTTDHIHILLSLPSVMPVSKAVQLLKGGSSTWIHERFKERDFAWQEGYGAFSVSISHVEETMAYIRNQAEHHRKRTFEEEFKSFLRKHSIEYDEAHVWG